MVALVRAAPQLDLPFVPVALNQQVIVSDVVTALQPSIAQAAQVATLHRQERPESEPSA